MLGDLHKIQAEVKSGLESRSFVVIGLDVSLWRQMGILAPALTGWLSDNGYHLFISLAKRL